MNFKFSCSICKTELDVSRRSGYLCSCQRCGAVNILPKSAQSDDMLNFLAEGNRGSYDSEFYKAFNSFRHCSVIDMGHSEIYFAMMLASNSVKYVYDPSARSYVPVCFDTTEKELLEDTNVQRSMQYADSDADRRDYEKRVGQISLFKEKFREFAANGVKYDVFISSACADGGGVDLFAEGLYTAMKSAGLSPFLAKKDLADNLENAEYLRLYALKSAKLFVQICDGEQSLNNSIFQSDYAMYYSLISAQQRKETPILLASPTGAVNSLPGLMVEPKTVDICSSECSKEINAFLKPCKNVKLKLKAVEGATAPEAPQPISCYVCGTEIEGEDALKESAVCSNCDRKIVLPKIPRKGSVVKDIEESATMLKNEDFDTAYKSYCKAIKSDPLEPAAWFGAYLAKNKVNYIFNTELRDFTPISHNTDNLSGFTKPAVIMAHALAKTDEKKDALTSAVNEIDDMRQTLRELQNQGREYDVYISIDYDEKKLGELDKKAKDLYSDLLKNGAHPFYKEIARKNLLDGEELYEEEALAISQAGVMVFICDNGTGIAGDYGDREDYHCYFEGKKNKRVIIVGKDNKINHFPENDEPVTWLYWDSSSLADDICTAVSELDNEQGGKKYCALCERGVKKNSVLCPHCLSFKFNEHKTDSIVANDAKFGGLIEKINKAFTAVSKHAVKFVIGFASIALVLILSIVLGIVSGIGRYTLTNSDHGISITVDSREFHKKDSLSVSSASDGMEYQVLKNQLGNNIGKEIEEMIIYNLSCDKELDRMQVKIHLSSSINWAVSGDIGVFLIDNGSFYRMDTEHTDEYISFYTYDLGSFALARIGREIASGGNDSVMDSDLYHLLQTAGDIDLSQYTPNSHEQFNNAYGYALDILGFAGASEKDIYDATERLRLAIESLEPIAFFADLQSMIIQAEECIKNKKHYTRESINDLKETLETARQVYNDKNATQNEVDEAYENLRVEIKYLDAKRTFFENLIIVVLTLGMLGVAHLILAQYDFPLWGEAIIAAIVLVFMILYMINNPEWTVWKMLLTDLIVTVIVSGGPIAYCWLENA